MHTIAILFTLITALLHGYFLILEMFLWTTPLGLRIFHLKEEVAHSSKALAANQGLYNGMLAAGLFFSFLMSDPIGGMAIRMYCLSFIIIVGCYGAYSLKNSKIFTIQALPALIALVANKFS